MAGSRLHGLPHRGTEKQWPDVDAFNGDTSSNQNDPPNLRYYKFPSAGPYDDPEGGRVQAARLAPPWHRKTGGLTLAERRADA